MRGEEFIGLLLFGIFACAAIYVVAAIVQGQIERAIVRGMHKRAYARLALPGKRIGNN
jgi:hypothetical protein